MGVRRPSAREQGYAPIERLINKDRTQTVLRNSDLRVENYSNLENDSTVLWLFQMNYPESMPHPGLMNQMFQLPLTLPPVPLVYSKTGKTGGEGIAFDFTKYTRSYFPSLEFNFHR